MKTTVLAIATTIILAPTFAMAGDHHSNSKHESAIAYTGPIETVSVASLLENTSMFSEQDTVVDGKIVRQLKSDTFIFSDGQSEIQIELDDDIRLAAPLTADTKIRIFGEYEGGKTPEIEVDHIQVL
ncbi:YgiW/YdeI family stress tolerance OB fold protein [Vibrio echinoideorum]|uniref:YgiW/YdeI family stress tolerance OB fold protein n=1 Tax=Vibrio echinoideorum TaxID=2100116 RepID=UPI00108176A3|nr:NirD/YgiW/YdeI family stress tolerance protein [Vibrio echinoideorum]TVU60808.1 NirD/YgiW/YdeI family stress tolerance protein [Vibrio atlanticus]